MTQPKDSQERLLPFGVQPGKSRAPLIALIVLFAAWFALLAWMAVQRVLGG